MLLKIAQWIVDRHDKTTATPSPEQDHHQVHIELRRFGEGGLRAYCTHCSWSNLGAFTGKVDGASINELHKLDTGIEPCELPMIDMSLPHWWGSGSSEGGA